MRTMRELPWQLASVSFGLALGAFLLSACTSPGPELAGGPTDTPIPIVISTSVPTPTFSPVPIPTTVRSSPAVTQTPMPTSDLTPVPSPIRPSGPKGTAPPLPTPTPTLGATPAPERTRADLLAPTPTAEASVPAKSVAEREVERLTEVAIAHVRWLSETLGPRSPTTVQEKQAADYIAEQFRSLGYEVSLQPFPVRLTEKAFRILIPVDRTFTTAAMGGSGEGDISAPLVFTGLARPQEFPENGLQGAIALIRRGQITFREKTENAVRAGASGVVIFNNLPGLFNGTLGTPHPVPVLAISEADGEALLELIRQGEVSAHLRVKPSEKSSNNVVAIKISSVDSPVVVLGAHYDSVPVSPGANDNASGTAVLLAVAQEVAQMDSPFELRFVAFGSEEVGLIGSRHYVNELSDDERGRIVAMLNLDALAQGGLVVGGDEALVQQALDIARSISVPLKGGREAPNTSSDHASFRSAGIPAIYFEGGSFANVHTPNDTVENVAPEQLGQAGTIASRLLAALALQVR